MKGFWENKYVQAAAVAFATGTLNALLTYVTHITDGLDWRHMTQDVGIAFLGPFLLLVSVLPKITDILTPTVRIVSGLPLSQPETAAEPEREIVSAAPTTTVAVDAPAVPITHRVVTPRPRRGGRSGDPPDLPARARPPAVPPETRPQETSG
jgi:hypothetical protein